MHSGNAHRTCSSATLFSGAELNIVGKSQPVQNSGPDTSAPGVVRHQPRTTTHPEPKKRADRGQQTRGRREAQPAAARGGDGVEQRQQCRGVPHHAAAAAAGTPTSTRDAAGLRGCRGLAWLLRAATGLQFHTDERVNVFGATATQLSN
jgi:hypothetical protein